MKKFNKKCLKIKNVGRGNDKGLRLTEDVCLCANNMKILAIIEAYLKPKKTNY